jgi:uncharacterized protein (TIGR02594 family)
MDLPKQYRFLNLIGSPRIFIEALKFFGLKETIGPGNNPVIVGWAKELGLTSIYNKDETPWCGLFIAVCMKRAHLQPPVGIHMLRALGFADWGKPADAPMFGDVLVFKRPGGGHVGLYIGEDQTHFHVLGGNQGDSVSIVRIEKARLIAARRTPWQGAQPANVRRIFLNSEGLATTNEV